MGILEPILTRVSDVSVRLAVCLVLEPVLLRGHADMVRTWKCGSLFAWVWRRDPATGHSGFLWKPWRLRSLLRGLWVGR